MKISVVAILLISLILRFNLLAMATPLPPAPAPSPSGFCDQKCGVRCAMKGRQSRCMKFCMMCCGRCNCVPSGTFANKDECPCYRDWISPNGRPKCP